MPTPKQGYTNKAGVPIPGCTTVLSALSGAPVDALLGWSARLAREGLDWKSERQRSADVGTFIHDALEHYPDPLPARPPWMTDDEWKRAEVAHAEWGKWLAGSGMRVVAKECHLVSEEHQAGGTPDLVLADSKGRLFLGDHKTGKTIDLPKVAAQLAFYADATFENKIVAEPVGNGLIFHYTPRGLRPIEVSPEQMTAGLGLFKVAREAYRRFKAFPRAA